MRRAPSMVSRAILRFSYTLRFGKIRRSSGT